MIKLQNIDLGSMRFTDSRCNIWRQVSHFQHLPLLGPKPEPENSSLETPVYLSLFFLAFLRSSLIALSSWRNWINSVTLCRTVGKYFALWTSLVMKFFTCKEERNSSKHTSPSPVHWQLNNSLFKYLTRLHETHLRQLIFTVYSLVFPILVRKSVVL